MQYVCFFVCLIAMASSLACGPLFRVKRAGQSVDGIPFYVKTAKCLQSSAYLAPYYRLILQSNNPTIKAETINISEQTYLASTAQELVSLIRTNPKMNEETLGKVLSDWNSLKAPATNIQPYTCITGAAGGGACALPSFLVGNTAVPKVFVDYGAVYTLNARAPFSGSANGDYKLNDDGTLTEASAQMEDKTFETAAGLFPAADLIKTAAGITAHGFDASGIETVALQLSIEQRGIKITRSKLTDFTLGCPVGAALTQSDDVSFEDVGPDTKEKKDAEANTISVSGTIKLPTPPQDQSSKDKGKADGASGGKGSSGAADKAKASDGSAPKKKGK